VERVGNDVQRELKRFGPAAGMAELLSVWPSLVGEQIAANAWPGRFARDGTLHVATSSSAWAFELTQLQGEILGRLRGALRDGAPTGLRFAPGKLPEHAAEEPGRPRAAISEPSAEHVAEAAKLAAEIEDENLREVVAKTAAMSLARAADGRFVW
jgi:hypothetical protein